MKNISTDRRDRIRFYQNFDWRFYMRASCVYMIALLGAASVFAARPTNGQGLEQEVTIGMEHETLRALFEKIEAVTDLNCIFKGESIEPYNDISFPTERRTLRETLAIGLFETGMGFYLSGLSIVFRDVEDAVIKDNEGHRAFIQIRGKDNVVSGVVKSRDGSPLPGVNIVVKGTTIGTATDSKGNFIVEVPDEGEVLVFSFIGYKTQELILNGRTNFDVAMDPDITTLQTVEISGGYYNTTDKEKTGSIVKVTSREIENQPVTSPLMSLQGRVAGVEVSPNTGVPGSALRIQIRGRNSLRNNSLGETANSPLYVVDGVMIDPTPIRSGSLDPTTLNQGYDPLSLISPNDIESIEILKDADATAIYGSRGANGVILIKTRRANGSAKSTFDFNIYRGVGGNANNIELLNTQQYLEMRREAFKNDEMKPNILDFDVNGTWDSTRNTNWQKELLGNRADIVDFQAGVSGGNSYTSFQFKAGYHREGTIYSDKFGYRLFTGHLSANHSSSDNKFKTNFSVSYGASNNETFESGSFISQILRLPPNAPKLYGENGDLNWEVVDIFGFKFSSFNNPLAKLRNTNEMQQSSIIGNGVVSYDFFDDLVAKVSLGFNNLQQDEIIKMPISAFAPTDIYPGTTASAVFGHNGRLSWIIDPQLSYQRQLGNHRITGVVGATIQRSVSQYRSTRGVGFLSDALLSSLTGASSTTLMADYDLQSRYAAIFFRFGYDFRGKYILNVTGRRDGSSRFGPGKRFGDFGAIGAAWVFSNERLISQALPFLSTGKIRGSYGVTGNDQIGDYRYFDTYKISTYKYQGSATLSPTALFNPDFSWESTRKVELAFELGLLSDRLYFELAWYRNRTNSQLIDYQLPSLTGFESVFKNFDAVVQNKGIEAIARFIPVKTSAFEWSVSVNFSKSRNTLVSFPDLEKSSYAKFYKEGEPLSIQSLFVYKGVNVQTGEYEFFDINDDDVIDEGDRDLRMAINKDYYGGVYNALRFKSFELSVLFQFVKQQIVGYVASVPPGFANSNMPPFVMRRWKHDGDISDVARFSSGYNAQLNNYRLSSSDRNIVDGSFIRLKTLTFSYQISRNAISRFGISGVRLFVQGQNLYTGTDYLGIDPETGVNLPPLRVISMGLNFSM